MIKVKAFSQPETLAMVKRHLKENFHYEGKTANQIRSEEAAAISALPKLTGTVTRTDRVGGLQAEWVGEDRERPNEQATILYFHGGAFIAGSCDTHRDLAARIAGASGAKVLTVEYRLAPEHKYPAANEDCLSAYRALIDSGISPDDMVIGGDSVGGTLALMTLIALRDSGEPLPAGAFLLSPHTDFLYFDSGTYVSCAQSDPLGSLRNSQMCAEHYLDGSQPKPAALSPLHQNLQGLPPLLIQVGEAEVLLGECAAFAEKAGASGVNVRFEVWEQMWCVFQQLAAIVPEGAAAIDHIGAFIKSRLH
ncbi:Monoterpene epsilon-lactone hydrolase [Paenibacillus konkukensis]|uniref:Monoterpene epsilon-lactone hydrolase n=1 Tax=Paenibacillus konkukensis TaxID=2020716 RepID=A0ABY4RHN8_9BACL|nr:alpha/beta hydrolase [Paenibacillus konkukensis]UQZ81660.1 Monoterpene epsilon-lactone hydrolase [Paenibacillus konkukensis]